MKLKTTVWRAIVECDPSYDGVFFYGVNSTGIVCRPSCKSRTPNASNVQVFSSLQEAFLAKFRPCKRCRPDALNWSPDQSLTNKLIAVLQERFPEPLDLNTLASLFHLSPFHLHRVFKRVSGRTVGEYLQKIRIDAASHLLSKTDMQITEIAYAVGFSSPSYFSTVFQKKTGSTPTRYRQRVESTSVQF